MYVSDSHETFTVVSNTLGSHEGNEDDIAQKYPSEGDQVDAQVALWMKVKVFMGRTR